MEEINLADYIQVMLIAPSLEPRAAVSIKPLTELMPTVQMSGAPQAAATDKGKGLLIPFATKKKAPPIKTGIIMGTPTVSVPILKEEEEPYYEGEGEGVGTDITLSPADIPLEGLSKDEHVALALKASMDAIREEQAARVASFIMIEPQVLYPFSSF